MYFGESLTFQTHIIKKLKIGYMRLKKPNLPSRMPYQLCESWMLSLFQYGYLLSNSSLNIPLSHWIQKIHNWIRFAYSMPIGDHNTLHLNIKHIINMAYRTIHLTSLFKQFFHNHYNRFISHIPPQHRTAGFHNSFKYTVIKFWNILFDQVTAFSYKHFSKYFKTYHINEQTF